MFNAQDDIRGLLIARRADCAVSLVARTAPWCAHVPFSAQPQSLVDLICRRHFFVQIENPACRRIGRGTPKPQAPPVHPWSERRGPSRSHSGGAQIFSGRFAGPAVCDDVKADILPPLRVPMPARSTALI